MTRLATSIDTASGTILVSILDIPDGYNHATVWRTLAGAETILVEATPVIGNRVDVLDPAAPPGWSISYRATVVSTQGRSLAVNPSAEAGTTGWSPDGGGLQVRTGGSAHTGANHLRLVANPPGHVPAGVATMASITVEDLANRDTATTPAVVSDSEATFVRIAATGTTETVSLQWASTLPAIPGQRLSAAAVARTSTLGAPPTAYLRIRIFFYAEDGTLLTTHGVADAGELPTAWTLLQGTTGPAPANAAKARFVLEMGRSSGDIRFSVNDRVDGAYFQTWASDTPATAACFVAQSPLAEPGQAYSGACWVRPGHIDAMAAARLSATFFDATGNEVSLQSGTLVPLNNDWDEIQAGPFGSPENTATVRFSIRGYLDAAGTTHPSPGSQLDIDDLYISDTTTQSIDVDPVSATLPALHAGDAWLRDPNRPDRSMRVLVQEQPSLSRSADIGMHRVVGRPYPVAVSDVRAAPTGDLTLLTRSAAERERLVELLSGGGVLVFQTTPDAQLDPDLYLVVDEAAEERVVSYVAETWRRHILSFAVVDRPGTEAVELPNTYEDLRLYGISYRHVQAERATYLDVLTTTFKPSPLAAVGAARI